MITLSFWKGLNTLNCKDCPWYDDGDFENDGKPYCRGILEFGQCPFIYTYARPEGVVD